MTEPTSGTPRPLSAEPAEPVPPDPSIEPDEVGIDEDADEAEPESVAVEEAVPGAAALPPPVGTAGRRRGAPAPVVQRAPTQSELAVRVTDNASRVFVLAAVVVFAAILAFGLLAGTGGLLTTTPAPTAEPSVSAEPSLSAAPPASAAPSGSAAASASPS